MTELTQLANDTMTLLAPLLPIATTAAGKLADHIGDGFLSEPGAKLFDWLTAQFRGKPSAATLERAIAEPQNPKRLDMLRLEIQDLAEKDAEFRRQLSELARAGITQIANPSGDNNKIAQVAGNNNSIQIS
jgi:hypothetical protein